jgi:hypothetical protein
VIIWLSYSVGYTCQLVSVIADGNFVLYKASLLDLPVSSAHRLAHVVRRLPKLSGNRRSLSGVSVDGTASRYPNP